MKDMSAAAGITFETLPDPKKDRVVSEIPAPPHKPIDKNVLFPQGIS